MENSVNTKPKIRVIPAKPRQELLGITTANGEKPKLRVGPYARVSTDHEEQESSYEAQVKHFKQLIESHDDWELVDIYADPGISGKNIKRPNFQRLMEDCENGKIDMVITKSVSRFARNTLDCVQCVRRLKELGIKVYFEKENLDTLQESSEFVLTLMASLAEEESRSISTNIRWSVKKRFENGEVILNTAHFLGYTKDSNKRLKIVPEEALIVRRIYGLFLDGYSLQQIAENLMNDGIMSPSGKALWHSSTIKSILTNEKYKGDCHLQKTYLPDFLSPRRIKNEGQADSYYVEDSHAAIISKETFDMVQQEFRNRKELRCAKGCGKYSGKYPFSGMIICGECGETYRRHQQYTKNNKYYIWVCKRHENTGKENCSAKPIREKSLEDAFVRALNGIINNKEKILADLQNAIVGTLSDTCDDTVSELNDKISKQQSLIIELLNRKDCGDIAADEYEKQSRLVQNKIDELILQKESVISEQSKVQLAVYRADAIAELLTGGKILEEFDADIFKSLVKQIKVVVYGQIEIEFECGIKVREMVR